MVNDEVLEKISKNVLTLANQSGIILVSGEGKKHSAERMKIMKQERWTISENERRTMVAVFNELMKKPYSELNTFLGSETIERMQAMAFKWEHATYAREHGKRVSQMDEADFEQEYAEKHANCGDEWEG